MSPYHTASVPYRLRTVLFIVVYHCIRDLSREFREGLPIELSYADRLIMFGSRNIGFADGKVADLEKGHELKIVQ